HQHRDPRGPGQGQPGRDRRTRRRALAAAGDHRRTATAVSAETLIESDGVVKDYALGTRKVHALRGVSVRIRGGEFVAVMGPSGSRKATFMNPLRGPPPPTPRRHLLGGPHAPPP